MDDLFARWRSLLDGFAPDAPPQAAQAAYADLAARHREPGRHYHTLDHVRAVLDRIDSLWPDAPAALHLAGWLHDAVYDPRAGDNEQRSAAFALELLGTLAAPPALGDEAARLILLTRTHEAPPDDRPGHVLLDADLAILAAPADGYDAYAAAIRREFAWVAEADYRAGRRRVLERFLARPRIFLTPEMHAAEPAARANLSREVARLG